MFAAKREETGAVRNLPLMERNERIQLAADAAKKVPRALDKRPANGCPLTVTVVATTDSVLRDEIR